MNGSNEGTFTVVEALFDNFVKAVASEIQSNKPSTDELFLKDMRDSLIMTINGLENRLADMEKRLQTTLPDDDKFIKMIDDRFDDLKDQLDPTEHAEFDYAVDNRIDDKFQDADFVESSDLEEAIRQYLRKASISLEVN